jgi:DnaJ-class molecular chaperone
MSATEKSYVRETCAWCDGTGKYAVSKGYISSCLVCGGKGQVSVRQPAGQCQQCQGTGRRNVASLCLSCSGTGWVRVLSPA